MIIGLNGKIGSGKDTIADYLVEHYGFKKVGFSDQLYAAVEALWGITHEQALEYKEDATVSIGIPWDGSIPSTLSHNWTWRAHLQRFGTEMARNVWGEDFWIDRFEAKYLEYEREIPDNQDLVVRDVRFNNEAKMLGDYGGFVWQIERPGYEGDDHESELGLHEGHIVGDVMNDGTIEELHEAIVEWMKECYGREPISVKN